MYVILTLFIAILFSTITIEANLIFSPIEVQILFFSLMIFIIVLMVCITYSFFRTKYVVSNGILHSWSPFAVINLKLNDIKKIERTMIPFYIRVGASLYSGMFYIPNIGWTKTVMTNLRDGVFITTKDNKRYLITPSRPDEFVQTLKKS